MPKCRQCKHPNEWFLSVYHNDKTYLSMTKPPRIYISVDMVDKSRDDQLFGMFTVRKAVILELTRERFWTAWCNFLSNQQLQAHYHALWYPHSVQGAFDGWVLLTFHLYTDIQIERLRLNIVTTACSEHNICSWLLQGGRPPLDTDVGTQPHIGTQA